MIPSASFALLIAFSSKVLLRYCITESPYSCAFICNMAANSDGVTNPPSKQHNSLPTRSKQPELGPDIDKESKKLSEDRKFAMRLLEQHGSSPVEDWFYEVPWGPMVRDIEDFAAGHPVTRRTEEYVAAMLNEFRLHMRYVDFLVDTVGLRHAGGVANCEEWLEYDARTRYQPLDLSHHSEIQRRLRDSIGGLALRPVAPQLPFAYLAACVYETHPLGGWRERSLSALAAIDKGTLQIGQRMNSLLEASGTKRMGDTRNSDSTTPHKKAHEHESTAASERTSLQRCPRNLTDVLYKAARTVYRAIYGRST